ncbi:MAG: YbaN family protein [Pseudomonadota bacterium]
MLRHTVLLLWRVLALASLALGVVGIALPVLPTVPFLLLSAWSAGKGWPQMEAWLLRHPRYGPPIRRWRERGAVPRSAKWLATAGMSLSALVVGLAAMAWWLKLLVGALLLGVGTWLWRRPEQ